MANIKSTIRKYLMAGVAKQSGVIEAQAALDAAKGGMYACTVQAAIAAKGDKAAFVETCDKLMDDFRGNVRGIAVKHGMEQAKDKTGKLAVNSDGNPRYLVPGSLSTAKSVLGGAFDHKIGLGTITKPNSFGSVRDAASVAKAEAKAAAATPDDKVRASITAHLEAISGQLAKMDSKSLKALDTLLAKMAKGTKDAAVATAKQQAA